MNKAVVLACKDLAKSFRIGSETLWVLRGVNVEVCAGESISIIGASGAGKTTLLSLLGGLEQPTEGSVYIQGQCLSTQTDAKRTQMRNSHLGFVYQLHHLLPEFSATENVQLPLVLGGMGIAKAQTRAQEVLAQVGMEHRLRHKPAELSGGERQRVAIARALVNNPDCVLLDEPTGNLDRHNAQLIVELLLQVCQDFSTALVLVTHDLKLASQLNRHLQLVDGQLVEHRLA